MKDNVYIFHLILIVSTLFLGMQACDTGIDGLNEEKGIYSIYGYLDMKKDTNFVRVKNLNTPLTATSSDSIDAKVTLKNLVTGNTSILKDSVIDFDGVKTHNFMTTMNLQPDTEYQLKVQRSDGRSLSATASTPYLANRELKPSNPVCEGPTELVFEPVRDKFALDLKISFLYEGQRYWVNANNRLEEKGDGVVASFWFENIVKAPFSPELVFCNELSSDIFTIQYYHYGPDLFEDNVSDSINIPGGAGRFGAFYKESFTVQVDTARSKN